MMSIHLINNGRKKHGSVLIFLLFFATDSDIRSHLLCPRWDRTRKERLCRKKGSKARASLPTLLTPYFFLLAKAPSSSFFPPSGRPGRRRAEGGATKRRRRMKLKPLFSSWPSAQVLVKLQRRAGGRGGEMAGRKLSQLGKGGGQSGGGFGPPTWGGRAAQSPVRNDSHYCRPLGEPSSLWSSAGRRSFFASDSRLSLFSPPKVHCTIFTTVMNRNLVLLQNWKYSLNLSLKPWNVSVFTWQTRHAKDGMWAAGREEWVTRKQHFPSGGRKGEKRNLQPEKS